jgi:hypothetical protein
MPRSATSRLTLQPAVVSLRPPLTLDGRWRMVLNRRSVSGTGGIEFGREMCLDQPVLRQEGLQQDRLVRAPRRAHRGIRMVDVLQLIVTLIELRQR